MAPETKTAKLFKHGGSQAVRLPKEFRLPGDRVRIRRTRNGILLQPVAFDVKAWFAEMNRLRTGEIKRAPQPPMPPNRVFFD